MVLLEFAMAPGGKGESVVMAAHGAAGAEDGEVLAVKQTEMLVISDQGASWRGIRLTVADARTRRVRSCPSRRNWTRRRGGG